MPAHMYVEKRSLSNSNHLGANPNACEMLKHATFISKANSESCLNQEENNPVHPSPHSSVSNSPENTKAQKVPKGNENWNSSNRSGRTHGNDGSYFLIKPNSRNSRHPSSVPSHPISAEHHNRFREGKKAIRDRIFVGGLSEEITDADLKTTFEKFGSISNINIPWDHALSRMRGYAFITFDKDESAKKAIEAGIIDVKSRKLNINQAFMTPYAQTTARANAAQANRAQNPAFPSNQVFNNPFNPMIYASGYPQYSRNAANNYASYVTPEMYSQQQNSAQAGFNGAGGVQYWPNQSYDPNQTMIVQDPRTGICYSAPMNFQAPIQNQQMYQPYSFTVPTQAPTSNPVLYTVNPAYDPNQTPTIQSATPPIGTAMPPMVMNRNATYPNSAYALPNDQNAAYIQQMYTGSGGGVTNGNYQMDQQALAQQQQQQQISNSHQAQNSPIMQPARMNMGENGGFNGSNTGQMMVHPTGGSPMARVIVSSGGFDMPQQGSPPNQRNWQNTGFAVTDGSAAGGQPNGGAQMLANGAIPVAYAPATDQTQQQQFAAFSFNTNPQMNQTFGAVQNTQNTVPNRNIAINDGSLVQNTPNGHTTQNVMTGELMSPIRSQQAINAQQTLQSMGRDVYITAAYAQSQQTPLNHMPTRCFSNTPGNPNKCARPTEQSVVGEVAQAANNIYPSAGGGTNNSSYKYDNRASYRNAGGRNFGYQNRMNTRNDVDSGARDSTDMGKIHVGKGSNR